MNPSIAPKHVMFYINFYKPVTVTNRYFVIAFDCEPLACRHSAFRIPTMRDSTGNCIDALMENRGGVTEDC